MTAGTSAASKNLDRVAGDAVVNWRQVGAFLGLTFGLAWALDLVLYLTAGYGSAAGAYLLQLSMLLPAFCAILLGLFVFRGSPIYYRRYRGRPRWFFYLYLAYTLFYALVAGLAVAAPQAAVALSLVSLAVTVLGLVTLVVLRATGRADEFARAGLSWGKPRHYLLLGAGFVLYYAAQAGLNYLFGLGQAVDATPLAQAAGLPPSALVIAGAVQSVLVMPFLGILIAFGEEYGWRGYLQGELVKLGRVRGVLLVGLIWGAWHVPAILMGHNYPGYPMAGVFMMTLYCVAMAFAFGYAALKSGSVLLAAFLHAINNQTVQFLGSTVYQAKDPLFSFGIGLYSLPIMLLVVLLILRDPLWRRKGAVAECGER